MATPTQLFTDRATAGAAYAAALANLQTTWTALRALDLACTNRAVLAAHPTGATQSPVYTFANASEWNPACLRHPVYAASVYVNAWDAAAAATALTHIANLS